MKTFKKFDFVIIVCLLILSFVPHFVFGKTLYKNYDSTYVSLKISGKHYKNILLLSKDEDEFVIRTPNGNNTLSIKDGLVQITQADCHDDLCVKQGIISKVGQSIICLPHELVIEIKGDNDSSDGDVILSY